MPYEICETCKGEGRVVTTVGGRKRYKACPAGCRKGHVVTRTL